MTPVLIVLYAMTRVDTEKSNYIVMPMNLQKHCYNSHDILHYHFSVMNV